MDRLKLFMALIGCTPPGRHTEQHDIFFGIAGNLKELVPQMIAFWPEAKGRLHIDSWREVTTVNDYSVEIVQGVDADEKDADPQIVNLFFLNLGGYKPGEFEEYHYKMLAACKDISTAISLAKKTFFYKHTGFKKAESHIDDKYGIDVDDVYRVEDILPVGTKEKYSIRLKQLMNPLSDELHIGYYKFSGL